MNNNRRPLASRKVSLFQNIAQTLVRWGLTPNQVSVASCFFALGGGVALARISTAEGGAFYASVVFALLGIQLRLLCNLFDGLMAVEGGMRTPTGDLFNDIPDRIADMLLIVGASYSVPFSWGPELGWAAAFFACLTAFIRALGASLHLGHDFSGPMAKQHRMAVLNGALLLSVLEKALFAKVTWSLTGALFVILVGSIWTSLRRTQTAASKLSGNKSL